MNGDPSVSAAFLVCAVAIGLPSFLIGLVIGWLAL